jgi:hypothetical protein
MEGGDDENGPKRRRTRRLCLPTELQHPPASVMFPPQQQQHLSHQPPPAMAPMSAQMYRPPQHQLQPNLNNRLLYLRSAKLSVYVGFFFFHSFSANILIRPGDVDAGPQSPQSSTGQGKPENTSEFPLEVRIF